MTGPTAISNPFRKTVSWWVAMAMLVGILFIATTQSASAFVEVCSDPKAPRGPNTVEQVGNRLEIVGDDYANNITLDDSGPDVIVFLEFVLIDTYSGVDKVRIWSCMGNDIIGLGAADSLVGPNHISTGEGDDIVGGSSARDIIRGGDGDDSISGDAGDDNIDGGGGNDQIGGSFGDDVLRGGKGDDFLFGGSDNDKLSGGSGDDDLYGNDDDDKLLGGSGNDRLEGGPGFDFNNCGSGKMDLVDLFTDVGETIKKCEGTFIPV